MTAPVTTTFLAAPELPPGRPNLVVTGFMGTGKTTAGKEAAAILGMPFVDLDRVVERRAGRQIAEIFASSGESAFREFERQTLIDAARLSGAVIATGGGAVLHEEAFALLALGSEVVVLTADPRVVAKRVRAGEGRPMLAEGDVEVNVRALLSERAERYAAAGWAVDTSHAVRHVAGREAARRYRERAGSAGAGDDASGPVRVDVEGPGGHRYPVLIGRGSIAGLPEALCGALPSVRSVVMVSEEAVSSTAGAAVADALCRAGIPATTVTVNGGEAGKNLDAAADLWSQFRAAGLSRTDAVVAVGGGSTLDMVGFAAATYARGVPLANVPTTLLAMVDAGLGGKVAIDHDGVKNLVGSFHHPCLVVADPAALDTLPAASVRHGLAEAVKEAVLASPVALDAIEADPPDARGLPRHIDWIVEQAVRIKAAYVGADPFDRGVRHSLNLGHTFAHAIESASGYSVPHGEAVALGTVAAARLGERLGVTPAGSSQRLRSVFEGLGLPVVAPGGLERAAMIAAIGADKKRRGLRTVFVVPAPEGAALIEGLDPAEAIDALEVEGGTA